MKKYLSFLFAAMVFLTSCSSEKPVAGDFKLAAPEDIVMYQVNPRVFAPSKSLNAVAARVDSIRALGINLMWIMPIYPIGEERSKNSPYSIKDYKAIASEFGTIDDMKNLVEVYHEKGIGVILDWVANHTAWDNAWLKEHPEWYTHDAVADTIISPRGPGWDWTDVADLNYNNKDMRAAMTDAMKFWIKDVGLDGLRCDVADSVPADFWRDAIRTLRKSAGNRKIVMLAEGKDSTNFTIGGFDLNYGWDYKDSLISVFVKGHSAENLAKADDAEYKILPEGKVKMRFTTNHDQSTFVTPCKEFTNDRGAMAAYVSTIYPHGGALIYGSQEVGYEKPINFFKYVPIDWMQKPDIYKEYQKLISIYNDHRALRIGGLKSYATPDVFAFEKQDKGERILVVVNVRNRHVRFSLPPDWIGQQLINLYSGEILAVKADLGLQPYEYRILKMPEK